MLTALAAAVHPSSVVFTVPARSVLSVAFSRDGKTLVIGDADGTVWLWSLDTHRSRGRAVHRYPPRVTLVAPSPDGMTLASGNADGTVRLWDLTIHRPITSLPSRVGRVYSVAFSPDGKTLAAAAADGYVQVWHVAYLTNVVRPLCESAGRSLTRAVWARYVLPAITYQKVCP